MEQIERDIAQGQYESAIESGHNLIQLALAGLHYFQTYDWLFLMTTIVAGYVGWMLYILLHLLKTYSTISFQQNKRNVRVTGNSRRHVRTFHAAEFVYFFEHFVTFSLLLLWSLEFPQVTGLS